MWFIISIVALSALAIALLRMDRSRPRRKAIERRQYFRQPSFYHTDFGRALAHVPFEAVAYVVFLLVLGAVAAALPPYGGNYRDCWLAEYFSWWPLIAIGILAGLTCFIGQFMGRRGKGKLDAMETISWLAPILALALGFLAAYPVFSEAAPSLRALDFFYGVQVPGEAMADTWACWIQTGDSVGCGQ